MKNTFSIIASVMLAVCLTGCTGISVKEDKFALARKIAAWKKHVRREWDNVRLVSRSQPQTSYDLTEKDPLRSEIVLSLGDLQPEDIGVELIFAQTDKHGALHISTVEQLQVAESNDATATYRSEVMPEKTGSYQVGIRIFAKNPLLPHRPDFECVKWL